MENEPISVPVSLRTIKTKLDLPAETVVLATSQSPALPSVPAALAAALGAPLDCPPLSELARRVLDRNTRPVPYTGPDGIQWPIVESLLQAGFHPERIRILVATGTHPVMTDSEMPRLAPTLKGHHASCIDRAALVAASLLDNVLVWCYFALR